jgi:hypothetical protein
MHSGGVMFFGDIERKYVCECGEMWSKAEVAPSWLCRRELNAQSQLEVDAEMVLKLKVWRCLASL